MRSQIKTIALFGVFAAGFFCPQASAFKFLIRYLIALMMFFSLLKLRPARRPLRREHAVIFLVNVLLGVGAWAVFFLSGCRTAAEMAFFTGIAPTGTAAGVVTGLLGGRRDFVISSCVATNLGMAFLLPFLIPLVTGMESAGIFLRVAGDLAFVLGLPFFAAFLCRTALTKPPSCPFASRKSSEEGLLRGLPCRTAEAVSAGLFRYSGDISFYLWCVTIFLIIANASSFLRARSRGWQEAVAAAAISLVLCFLGFSLGRCIGGRKRSLECGQALGQKNTTLTLYLALVYAAPAAALGPAFYVIWHNSWNALQLWKRTRHLNEAASGRMKHV